MVSDFLFLKNTTIPSFFSRQQKRICETFRSNGLKVALLMGALKAALLDAHNDALRLLGFEEVSISTALILCGLSAPAWVDGRAGRLAWEALPMFLLEYLPLEYCFNFVSSASA